MGIIRAISPVKLSHESSRIRQKRIDDETDKIKIACLQAIEPLCPDVQRIILGEVQKANSIDHPWLFL